LNKILHIILITLFSLTVISCAKEEEEEKKTEAPVIAEVTVSDDTPGDNDTTATSSSSGKFVALGVDGEILSSENISSSWTSRTSGTSNTLRGVTSSE